MSRLGRLWSEIEGCNRANCDSSNQQFTHRTLLSFEVTGVGSLTAYTLRLTRFIAQPSLGFLVKAVFSDEAAARLNAAVFGMGPKTLRTARPC